ncbi:MAG: YqeG family HAD IIIA-type phosphatase [Candidatus Aquicultorales bacterium]
MLTKFFPSEYCDSIFDIDLEALRSSGIDGLVVDLDNTIIPRNSHTASESLREWLARARSLDFKICILSNNWMTRVSRIANQLSVPLVARAAKPRKKAFALAMKEIGTTPGSTAVIGDQIFTDVLGGNLSGAYTILVVPISDKEAPHTRLLRKLERVIMKNYHRQSGS